MGCLERAALVVFVPKTSLLYMVTFDSDEFLQLGEVMADQGLQEMLQQRNEKHHFTRFDRTDE